MLGIVTGALRDEVENALEQAGLRARFKVVVTGEDVAVNKPDPAGYRLGIERLNSEAPLPERLVHPHEVMAIEDSPQGLAAAGAAGLVTLGLAQSYPAEHLAAADAVAPGLGGLSCEGLRMIYARSSRS